MRILSDPICLEHPAPAGYPEEPARLEGLLTELRRGARAGRWQLVEDAGSHLDPVDSALHAVHEGEYIRRFERAVARGDGLLDSADNPLGRRTWEVARAAVAIALQAADWVIADAGRQAFGALRPPGHHAEAGAAMGFCFFNNIAVAAQYLIDHHALERVAIVDFDVHHGNGTQHIFEQRADVLFISTHQSPFYPGTGLAAERGSGKGEGATLNLPLPAGGGDADYRAVLEGQAIPALIAFQPEILLVSAGFDAWRGDPLGGMRVSEEGFRDWGRLLGAAAAELCQGRVLSLLEGGYDLNHLPALVEAYLEGLIEASRGALN